MYYLYLNRAPFNAPSAVDTVGMIFRGSSSLLKKRSPLRALNDIRVDDRGGRSAGGLGGWLQETNVGRAREEAARARRAIHEAL